MTIYRLLPTHDGHGVGPSILSEYASDEAAELAARTLVTAHLGMEVWEGARFVVAVDPGVSTAAASGPPSFPKTKPQNLPPWPFRPNGP